jgi:thiosulfate/3-mercaptopyruvate sulfurtransferase
MTQSRYITLSSYLVTPAELHNAMKKNVKSKISTAPRIIPLCATWFMPNDLQGRTGIESFKTKRIPSARFFDLDACKDHDSKYPHMLPTCEGFASAMQKLGIRRDDEIVVYDSEDMGIFSAPRVGWTFRVFGHPRVHLLNNFKLWVKEGYPTESGEPEPVEKSIYPVPKYEPDMVVKFAEVKEIARDHGKEGSEEIQILDARSRGRWAGNEKEPRPGLSSGHIPGSVNIPFGELLHPTDKTFLSKEELKKLFEEKGIDPSKQIISSCGTGVTAAIIDAALDEADFGKREDRRIYDGSWT